MHVQKWWKENCGFELDGFGEVDDAEGLFQDAKEKAIERLFGDLDQSFRFISKLMSELHSSNGLLVDWQYDSVVICLLQVCSFTLSPSLFCFSLNLSLFSSVFLCFVYARLCFTKLIFQSFFQTISQPITLEFYSK